MERERGWRSRIEKGSKDPTVSKIADWITIVTGPLTLVTAVIAGIRVKANGTILAVLSGNTLEVIATIAFVVLWMFVFWAQFRVAHHWTLRWTDDQDMRSLVALMANFAGLVSFYAIYLVMLDITYDAVKEKLLPLVLLWIMASIPSIRYLGKARTAGQGLAEPSDLSGGTPST